MQKLSVPFFGENIVSQNEAVGLFYFYVEVYVPDTLEHTQLLLIKLYFIWHDQMLKTVYSAWGGGGGGVGWER